MATDADFATAVQFVLSEEVAPPYRTTPVVDDAAHATPGDPGGLTKFGISQQAYPNLDIANLTVEQATQLYYTDYWQASGADAQPMPLAEVMLDTAVNLGVGEAQALLEQSGGDVTQYLALRVARYNAIAEANPSEAGFLSDWLQRVDDLAAAIGPTALGGGFLLLLGGIVAVVLWHKKHPGRL